MNSWYSYILIAQFSLSVVIFIVLLFVTAPYGRYVKNTSNIKSLLSPRVSWIVMESPAFSGIIIYSLILFFRQPNSVIELAWAPFVFLGLWGIHYFYRFIIYPFLLKKNRHPMPLSIVICGAIFNIINGLINAWWLMRVKTYSVSEFVSPHFVIGTSLFFIGFVTHVYSDHLIRKASITQDKQYIIPMQFPHTLISSPNYLGEIIQWTGWAIAAWSLAGASFAVFTAANLIPRALKHLRWYRTQFPDYPKHRKAILPFIL